MDEVNGGECPMVNTPNQEHPDMPRISPEEQLRLQAQAAESARLQEAVVFALQIAQQITAEKQALDNDKADSERLLQEMQLSLKNQTQQNANLVQQQQELNHRLQALTAERDAAMNQKDNVSGLLSGTREVIHAQIQEKTALSPQLDIATSRERDLILERDSTIAYKDSLEAQIGPLIERVNELQGRVDYIPILQQSLECARLETEHLPVLHEQVKQSASQIKSLKLNLSTQKRNLLRELDSKRRR